MDDSVTESPLAAETVTGVEVASSSMAVSSSLPSMEIVDTVAASTVSSGRADAGVDTSLSMDEDAVDEAAMMEAADAADDGHEEDPGAGAGGGGIDVDGDAQMTRPHEIKLSGYSSSSSSCSSSSSARLLASITEQDPPEPELPRDKLVDLKTLQRLCKEARETEDWAGLEKYVASIFDDPVVLAASFLKVGAGREDAPVSSSASVAAADLSVGTGCVSGTEGILMDVQVMDGVYAEIKDAMIENETLCRLFAQMSTSAGERLLLGQKESRKRDGVSHPTPKGGLRTIIFLMSNPLLSEGIEEYMRDLLSKVCECIAAVSLRERTLLIHWLASDACSSDLFRQWLKCLQQFITITVFGQEDLTKVSNAIKAMHILYRANMLAGEKALAEWKAEGAKVQEGIKAPYQEFYNDAVNEFLFNIEENRDFVVDAYRKWRKDQEKEKKRALALSASSNGAAEDPAAGLDPDWLPDSYISYPFILSPATKSMVLSIDAQSQMRRVVEENLIGMLFSGQVPYLILKVRRSNIIQDTMSQLARFEPQDLKKPLKVVFEGEEGIDEGGVQKEFMQVVLRQLLDAQYGMFKVNEDSNLMYFNPHTFEIGLEFELIGTLLGVAIHNSIIMDVKFPEVVYKRLKGMTPNIHDLAMLDPQLGRNLQKMIDFDGDVEATFGQVFQVTFEAWGVMTTHDLVPNGGDVPVTNNNVQDYIDRYVQWVLVDSVKQQYDAFHKGFMRACGGNVSLYFTS